LPAYESLCLVSLVALAGLVLLSARFARQIPYGTLVLACLAATPVVGVQLFGNLTELPFGAALMGMATALAVGRSPVSWWTAATCALLALSLRYAGVIAYAILWMWIVIQARRLRADGTIVKAVMALACSTLIAMGLLFWNLRATGHLSGASRASTESLGLAAWPSHVADLGWAPSSALMLGRLHDRLGTAAVGQLLGVCSSLALAALCLWGWMKPQFPWVRALAFVAFSYGAGMTVLRSIGTFDPLFNGRVVLPALFPLGLVACAQFSVRWPRLVVAACVGLLANGIASTARGLSREIAGEIQGAVPLLRSRLRTGDYVQINDHAFSVAAYVPQRTLRMWPETWRPEDAQRFIVVAAETLDRGGTPGPLSPEWRALAGHLVAEGTYQRILDTPALLVLERNTRP
jgi:hypothetical protein